MKSRIKASIGTAIFALTLLASATQAHALDSRIGQACMSAFAGKCYHTGDIGLDLSSIQSELDADIYCDTSAPFCGANECSLRLKVLAGIYASQSTGNPCLPF